MPNYKPDLTVFFLNTNACFTRNVGLVKEENDVAGMLKFLEIELQKLEQQTNQSAWIIGNINPGSKSCNTKWARRYNIIIERHQRIVKMQLFGHEAEEYFQLQYPLKGSSNPFGVTIQGAKASSYGQNPKFKIIEVDKQYLVP